MGKITADYEVWNPCKADKRQPGRKRLLADGTLLSFQGDKQARLVGSYYLQEQIKSVLTLSHSCKTHVSW